MTGLQAAQERAELWRSASVFDAETRAQAERSMQNQQELLSAFGSELSFGTGGLRGIIGVGTARMNIYTVGRATLGLGKYLLAHGPKPSVVIVHDSRLMHDEFTRITAGVLASLGIQAHVFPTLVPTPVLSFAVRELNADAGVMITASHNPAQYNGYKVYGADGCQITDDAAAAITAAINETAYTDLCPTDESAARDAGLWSDVPDTVLQSFLEHCLSVRVHPELAEPLTVAYTPLNGTGHVPVRAMLDRLGGITLHEVEAQALPDGHFPTCPKPNPELNEALALGLKLASDTQADLLLGTDPGCDRVGVAARDQNGAYIRFTGNEIGLILLDYILSQRAAAGTLPQRPVIVKTIVSADLAFPIAKRYGAEVREVLTGFKYIGETIGELEKDGRDDDFVFGFEESCGYLAGSHVRDKDGVMACMLVCEAARFYKQQGLTLPQVMQRIYDTYGYLGTRLCSFDIDGAVPMEKMRAVMSRLRESPFASVAGRPVTSVRDYLPGLDRLPPSNVLIYEADAVKMIVRPSGTEPKVKVYLFANAADAESAEALLNLLERDARTAVLGE